MECKKCNNIVEDTANFCRFCGANLKEQNEEDLEDNLKESIKEDEKPKTTGITERQSFKDEFKKPKDSKENKNDTVQKCLNICYICVAVCVFFGLLAFAFGYKSFKMSVLGVPSYFRATSNSLTGNKLPYDYDDDYEIDEDMDTPDLDIDFLQ